MTLNRWWNTLTLKQISPILNQMGWQSDSGLTNSQTIHKWINSGNISSITEMHYKRSHTSVSILVRSISWGKTTHVRSVCAVCGEKSPVSYNPNMSSIRFIGQQTKLWFQGPPKSSTLNRKGKLQPVNGPSEWCCRHVVKGWVTI